MSGSKHFDKIAWAVTAFILVATILFMNGGALGLEAMAHTMGYENRLFDNTRVHTIDIVMDNWDELIANATSEEYYTAHVVIDGEAYKNVAIRGKGNTSLSTVSSMDSNRYSFKVEFDHYDSSITYHGLDKLSLNNLIQDTTMMKDYLTYTMMNEFGVVAPLCSFVYLTVNGEDWGLYLAVEGVEDSFLERNYGSNYGELYKPDSMSFGGGRGNGKDFNMDNFDPSQMQDGMPQMPDMARGESNAKTDDTSSFGGGFNFGGMGGFGMGSSDVKLQYVDDNLSSYTNIWNNAKTDSTTADQTRLVASLKKLSNQEQLESVVDIEAVIRYFVVHNYVCNGDSYTGSMIHNYYLYEENGTMAMIPWDYNLAFGTFQGGNGQSTVNTPIDAPVSGGAGEDRPMWHWILADARYTEQYHQYFAEFLNTVDVQAIIDDAYNLIQSYVAKDPTAFYTYEEFETGVATMRQFCALRSESISMQLANGETTTNQNYVDASALTLSNMGSMGMGGGFGGQILSTDELSEGFDPSQIPNMGELPEGFDPSQMQGGFTGQMPNMGKLPEGVDPSQMQGGFGGMFPGGFSDNTGENLTDNVAGTDSAENTNRPSRDNMQMPSGDFDFNGNGAGNAMVGGSSLLWLVVSVLILGVGLLIAKRYRY